MKNENQPSSCSKLVPDEASEATVWFAALMHAKQTNDFPKAAEAQDELKALGIAVKFHRRQKGPRR